MLTLWTDTPTIFLLTAAVLLSVSLYLSVRLRRIEGLIQRKIGATNSAELTLTAPEIALPPPALTSPLALLQSNPADAQFEALSKRLDSITATLTVLVAGERPLVVTQLMAWSFEETIAEFRRE